MALSVMQDFFGVDWPLGFVSVANNGTPVGIMKNVDPNNNWAPGTDAGGPSGNNANKAEYTPTTHKIFFQGYHPGTNNNGMVVNSGYVYILRKTGPTGNNAGGPMNREDSGAIVQILPPGGQAILPADEYDGPTISPYRYMLDVDVDGEGALVTLIGAARG